MKRKFKSFLRFASRLAPFVLSLALILLFLIHKGFSVEAILSYTPKSKLLAALFLIALYALKSFTVFFPLVLLEIAGGFLFTPLHAMIINLIGISVELSVSYWIGRFSGSRLVKHIFEKHPKLSDVMERRASSSFLKAIFLRSVTFLPGDAVGMYLGATRMPFGAYLLGSLLGSLPSTVIATLLGTSITDPSSPTFWVSLSLTVLLSLLSFLIYWLWFRRRRRDRSC